MSFNEWTNSFLLSKTSAISSLVQEARVQHLNQVQKFSVTCDKYVIVDETSLDGINERVAAVRDMGDALTKAEREMNGEGEDEDS
jgi:hypothetical protein